MPLTSPFAPALSGFDRRPVAPPDAPRQQSLDDLGTPLAEVTFVVVDLETTGTSPRTDAITEIGALRMRGGELLGTFETFVNPGVPIPPMITVLTGITDAMLLPAPKIDEVLPAFLEFAHGAVIVGHNIRFDVGFLDAALRGARLPAALAPPGRHRRARAPARPRRSAEPAARRRSPVTSARRSSRCTARTPTRPRPREVLHSLLERAASYGVLGLDDLLALPTMRAHPSAAKLALTAKLPRRPGVYLFRDRAGRVLYVGKATNLRARVRSYFSTEDRRKVPQLLRETERIEHRVCRGPFEAAVRELRLIQRLEPRFNRASKSKRGVVPQAHRRAVPAAHRDAASRAPTARRTSGRSGRARPRTARARRSKTRCRSVGAARASDARRRSRAGRRACPRSSASRRARAAARSTKTSTRRSPTSCGAGSATSRRCCARRWRRACTASPRASGSRRRPRPATGSRRSAQALQRQRAMDALRGAERLVLECDEGRLVLAYGRVVLDESAAPPADEAPDLAVPPAAGDADELMLVSRWLQAGAAACAASDAVGARRVAAARRSPTTRGARRLTAGRLAGRGPGPAFHFGAAGGLLLPSAARGSARCANAPPCTNSAAASATNGISRAIGQKRPQPSASATSEISLVVSMPERLREREHDDERERDRDDPQQEPRPPRRDRVAAAAPAGDGRGRRRDRRRRRRLGGGVTPGHRQGATVAPARAAGPAPCRRARRQRGGADGAGRAAADRGAAAAAGTFSLRPHPLHGNAVAVADLAERVLRAALGAHAGRAPLRPRLPRLAARLG